ncbi:MAG: U32 family peptidase, partial [Verrucomicrobiota bacterium]
MNLSPPLRPELLAPAGNRDCAKAAVACGADAIYFGLPEFNARLRADNFSSADLPELMRYLHDHGVRGLVTMNTLIFASELPTALAQLRCLEQAGVDAIIVQDLGLAHLASQITPGLELHASTQMTLTSPEGLSFVDGLFPLKRAVLARELSLDEIQRFSKEDSPPVPLEVFVHGALCVAYSGQCLTSESLGQRSANRGECAQACRMPYTLVVDGEERDLGEVRYLLSPQDLAAVDLVPRLIEAGIASFKIEGRLKSPEYVTAVTSVYRKAIDRALGQTKEAVDSADHYALEMTFSRGLSQGWLEGTNHPRLTHGRFGKKRGALLGMVRAVGRGWLEIDSQHPIPLKPDDGLVFDSGEDRNEEQGGRVWKIEGKRVYLLRRSNIDWERVRPGQTLWKTDDPVLNKELKRRWKNARPDKKRKPLHILIQGRAGESLTLSCDGVTVRSELRLEKASQRPFDDAFLKKQLGRLGQTSYELGSIDCQLDGEVMLPVSALNELRRQLVTRLDEAVPAKQESVPSTVTLEELLPPRPEVVASDGSVRVSVLCRTMDQVEAALQCEVPLIYCDFEDLRRYEDAVQRFRENHPSDSRLFLATPRIQKTKEAGYFKLIERMRPDGVLIRNLGGISWFKTHSELPLIGDFSLNVANPLTARLLMEQERFEHLTVSYDLNISQVLDLLAGAPPEWFELTLHQHIPMFHMEHCVFCTFMTEGTSYKDCGRPCEKHVVQLKDRVGQLHTLQADVGCRNTLFNGRAQTGARFLPDLRAGGLSRFRIELLTDDREESIRTIGAYQKLLVGQAGVSETLREVEATERLGVT